MTTLGEMRARYAREVERAPSRFANEGRDYRAWAARADLHMGRVAGARKVGDAVEA